MWLKLDESAPDHPKIRKLARYCNVTVTHSLGLMCSLWIRVHRISPDGDLKNFDDDDIADAAGWDGEPSDFVESCVRAGLLDRTENGLQIHDCIEYWGSLHTTQRVRKHRAKQRIDGDGNVTETLPKHEIAFEKRRDKIRLEESRRKKEINKERNPPKPDPDPLEPEIEIVAKHFAAVHPELRRQADKRSNRGKIRARLTERLGDLPPYTAQELCDAIDGNAEDPWHCDVRKHDLEYVLRDTEHVDRFISIKKLGPGRPQKEYAESHYEREMRAIEEHNARVRAKESKPSSGDTGVVCDANFGLGAYLPPGQN